MSEKKSVELVGRYRDDSIEIRSGASKIAETGAPYEIGGTSSVTTAELFASTDTEDRGGVVLRVRAHTDTDEVFLPYAVKTIDGFEIHIAGDEEARAMVIAMHRALSEFILLNFDMRVRERRLSEGSDI